MTTVVAVDLDRTLIYSEAAIAVTLPAEWVPPLLCVEMLDGSPLSFMTVRAADWLEALRSRAELVPVTTRTLAQFGRVRLPGGPTRFAVTSNGGHIVVDGRSDERWRRTVTGRLSADGAALGEVIDELARRAAEPWALKRRVADELFCYLVVDLAALPVDFLPSWTEWCATRGWVVSQQGRKIYALPRGLTKEEALLEVRERTGAGLLLAAGDGALDAGFLRLADAGIRPPHGELAENGWHATSVRVASAAGVLAGEEISRWLALQVGVPVPGPTLR